MMYVDGDVCLSHVQRSEGNFRKSILSFSLHGLVCFLLPEDPCPLEDYTINTAVHHSPELTGHLIWLILAQASLLSQNAISFSPAVITVWVWDEFNGICFCYETAPCRDSLSELLMS